MLTKKLLIVLMITAFLITACASQQTSVSLSLAVSDGKGAPSESSVLAFVEEVRTLSKGKITIEPTWDAGADTEAGFEQGVIAAVMAGQYDLGLAASRAWEEQGITAFQPLQTPFLIDNDELAISVATSDTAAQMLGQLSSSGITGLTMWPEDLRHPFSVVPGKPLLSPNDFAGATIRTTSMGITAEIMSALGGKPEFEAFDYQGTESGLRQGSTLTGRPIATGNVVFFSKFQVLFANSAAFDRLSSSQRKILREAAEATQAKTIADRPSDAEAGTAWCNDGGSIVLASETQLAAFQKAVQPVIDQMEADADNAKNIAAIRNLKAKTQPGPGVTACGNIAAGPATDGDEEIWSEGLPPNGLWQVDLTTEDVMRMGVLESNAEGWAGLSIYEFRDGEGTFHGEFLDGFIIDCPFTYEVVKDFFRLTYVDLGLENYECGEQVDDLQWRLDPDGLHLHVVAIHEGLLVENTALYEAQPWQKIEEWSEGLPPEGVWQVKLSEDDIVKMGVLKANAPEWAGTWTWTFQDGKAHLKAEVDITFECDGNYTVVKDFVRINYNDSKDCSAQEVDDIQWRLDNDGLHLHLIAITYAPFTENKAYLEAKPWQKVEEWIEGLPPNGVYQVELTADDFTEAGVLRSVAQQEWAGVYTFTFDEGNFQFDWQGEQYTGKCQATYEVIEDFVRLTYYSDTDECKGQVDEVRWQLDDDGLHWQVIAIQNAPGTEITVIYETKPWQKIANP